MSAGADDPMQLRPLPGQHEPWGSTLGRNLELQDEPAAN